MKVFYFTATGNSLAVAKAFAGETISIPQVFENGVREYKDDVIGIVFPTYANQPPKMVQDFLSKTRLKADYIFAVATYGLGLGNPFKYAQLAADKQGYKFDYTKGILMEDNFLDNFEQQKQINGLPKKKINENLDVIKADIRDRKHELAHIGVGSKIVTKMCEPLFKGIVSGSTSDKFILNDNCVGCSICCKVCPAGNITIDKTPRFLHQCQGCYACLHACPKNALHLKKEKSNVRFRNEAVTLEEIISSNNRG